MDKILLTAELHAGGGCETGTISECARLGDVRVDTKGYLLVGIEIVYDPVYLRIVGDTEPLCGNAGGTKDIIERLYELL